MLENLLTDIESSNFDLSTLAEAESKKRVVNCERLQHLERIKIVTKSLIGEIQTRPDYRYARDRSFWKHCPVSHIAQRTADAEARRDGPAERAAPSAGQERASGRLSAAYRRRCRRRPRPAPDR